MGKNDKLTASLENYLNAIYVIVKQNQAARVKDVSKFLSIGAPSVSEALKILVNSGYINYQPYGIITLTKKGEKAAVELSQRHTVICEFLRNVLLIDEKNIEAGAKSIEHGISEEILSRLVSFLTFMQTCACKEPRWIRSYKHYAKNGFMQDKCNTCIEECAKNPDLICNSNCCGKSH